MSNFKVGDIVRFKREDEHYRVRHGLPEQFALVKVNDTFGWGISSSGDPLSFYLVRVQHVDLGGPW